MEQPTEKLGDTAATRTWMPMVGGILSIISGSLGFIAIAFFLTFGSIFGAAIARDVLLSLGFWHMGLPMTIIGIIAIILLCISAVAIIGGIYAIQRRGWGMALAGAICSIFPSQVLGILAIVFITISRKEFE
ncbi:MAG TPA: hypothetical protein G4O19_05055 [Dehalococcoidia bacterium]|nr:hypothetical protein [Dehalococcoidia bacterium]